MDINWDNLNKDELKNETVLQIKDYIKSLEAANASLKDSNDTLTATNQRLYLKLSEPLVEDKPDVPVDSDEEIRKLFKLGGKK